MSGTWTSGEDEHLAVLADDGEMIALDRNDELGLVGMVTFITCLPLRVLATIIALGNDEAIAGRGKTMSLRAGSWHEGRQHVLVVLHIDHDAQGFSVARPPGSLSPPSV